MPACVTTAQSPWIGRSCERRRRSMLSRQPLSTEGRNHVARSHSPPPGDTIKIRKGSIEVCILRILDDGRVSVGVSAPKEMLVLRGELNPRSKPTSRIVFRRVRGNGHRIRSQGSETRNDDGMTGGQVSFAVALDGLQDDPKAASVDLGQVEATKSDSAGAVPSQPAPRRVCRTAADRG